MRWNGKGRVYSHPQWRIVRRQVFKRDGYLCQECKLLCHGVGRHHMQSPECDHIIEATERPDLALDPKNLRTLCKSCHIAKTGIRVGHDINGFPTSPSHPWNKA